MLGNVELEALEVAEQRNGVGVDIREVPTCRRRAVEVRIDDDLLLREIDDRHVVAVVETFDVIELDRLIIRSGKADFPGTRGDTGRLPTVTAR
jgi:hypothetical protein